MADEVYLSVFDKIDGKRVTSYTIMGEIHGKTMDDLQEKAATNYPDAYAVPQTREDWRRTVSNDLRWNGSELVNPPEPTAEELQAQALAALDGEYQAKFNNLDDQIVKAAALKNTSLQDELIEERNALSEEYAAKRGEL